MAAPGADGWLWDPLWYDASGGDRTVHAMLADIEAAFRKSADLLRACGSEEGARRVQRFAARARFDLDEPVMARRLYLAVARLRRARQLEPLTGHLLEEVRSLARADRGNVQLADPESGTLRSIAQHGFDERFLHHFAEVADDRSACGRAAKRNAQLVITDVVPAGADRLDQPWSAPGNHRTQVSMTTGSPTAIRPGVMVEP